MGRHAEPIEPRFWAKVEKSDGCWLWTGAKTSRGYGVIQSQGRAIYVHRLALALSGHVFRPGEMACHHCDTPLCVRPDHLFVGDVSSNAADMVAKGRSNRRPKPPEHRANAGAALRRVWAEHPEKLYQRQKTHCPQGHPYSLDNTYVYRGRRHCRTCVLAQNRAAYWRRKTTHGNASTG